MEIIKKGVIPNGSNKKEIKYKGICEYCGCEFIVNDEELKTYVDIENNIFGMFPPTKLVTIKYYICPTCGQMVTFDKYKTDGMGSVTNSNITWQTN